jgi:SAM-dependent methyltransferase
MTMSVVHEMYRVVGGYFRRRRLRWVQREFSDCKSVVDFGGRVEMWSDVKLGERTTVMNVEPPPRQVPEKFTYLQRDATHSGFSEHAFDLAFSNSVIEHVGSFEDQKRFAGEMLRVGKRVYCQTPNKWFPVEPHFLGLGVHWLPKKWFGHFVDRYLTVHGWRYRPSAEASAELINSIRLLNRSEVRELFPGCNIKAERFMGMTKSFVVWK